MSYLYNEIYFEIVDFEYNEIENSLYLLTTLIYFTNIFDI